MSRTINQVTSESDDGLLPDSRQKHPRVFYGWYIVGACVFIILYTGGITHFGFTAVFEPIAEEFGWSYAQISLATSLRGAEMGLLAPIVGFMVDRWGPRRLVFGGGILLALGLILLSKVSSLAAFYGSFALVSIGFSTCSGTVLVSAVANWFRNKVGIATGIAASGFGLGGLLIPVVTTMIDALQWRTAMLISGFGMLVIVLPLSLMLRHKPEEYGYQLDGEVSENPKRLNDQTPTESVEISFTAKQAMKNRAFWHVAIAAMCHSFVVNAIVTHMMPFLSTVGIARSVSSLLSLFLPVASVAGRMGSGWLGDKIGRKRVFTVGFVSMTVGLFLFGFTTTGQMWQIVVFIITFSLGWGISVTSRITMLREHFGRGSFATILGLTQGVGMIGNMMGAPVAGWVFDTWGSYQGAWFASGTITFIGTILIITIPAVVKTTRQAALR